jgi:hypothetical protein
VCTLINLCFSAMHVQMDISWVHSVLFSTKYVNGVKEFMDFIKEKLVTMMRFSAHVLDA